MLSRPIEMVVQTDIKGNMKPIRFRINDENNEKLVVIVEKFKEREVTGFTNGQRIFDCLVAVNDMKRRAEIHYDIMTMKWTLNNLK